MVAQLRPGRPLDAGHARLRPARVGAADRRHPASARSRSVRGAWYWSRRAGPTRVAACGRRSLDPEIERLVDEELARFEWSEKLPVAFLAGLVSVITPCVLPLVPGYLSASPLSRSTALGDARRCEARRRGQRAVHRSASRSVFVAARRRRRPRSASVVDQRTQTARSPASCSSCSVSRSSACCRCPSGGRAGAAAARARDAARARCSAVRSPCAPPRASARCSPRSSCWRRRPGRSRAASILLVAYSLGLGAAFVAAGVAFASRDARVPLRPRPLRRRAGGFQASTLVDARPAALLQPRLVAARRARPGVHADRSRHALARASSAATSSPRWCGCEGREAAQRLPALALRCDRAGRAPCWYARDDDVDEPLEEVALVRLAGAPRLSRTPRAPRRTAPPARAPAPVGSPRSTVLGSALRHGDDPALRGRPLHPGEARGAPPGTSVHDGRRRRSARSRDRRHRARRCGRRRRHAIRTFRFSVITNHTDTAGLRRAHAAGFDQVVAKSALFERTQGTDRCTACVGRVGRRDVHHR